MAAENNDIQYTAADFEQYHNGSMPAAAMHALEKAALEDSFLADALDGYAFAPTAMQDIQELRTKIPPAKEDRKTPVIAFTAMWLRIAALFILVVGIGYISYTSLQSRPGNTMAKLEKNTVMPPSTEPATIAAPGAAGATVQEPVAAAANTDTLTSQPAASAGGESFSPVTTLDRSIVTPKQQEIKQQTIASAKPATAPSKESYTIKSRVADSESESVLVATTDNGMAQQEMAASENEKSSLSVMDSIMQAKAPGQADDNANKSLAVNKSQSTIAKKNEALNEVVVVGYGSKKKKEITGATTTMEARTDDGLTNVLAGKVAGVQVTAIPAKGMAAFDKYMADSTRAPVNSALRPVHGQVILSFNVSKKGVPVNIKADSPLCPACAVEAIRLLQNGPRWTYVDKRRVSTTIQF